MKFAVVIITPVGYVHSQAFREVAETLQFGLSRLGHAACVVHAPVNGYRNIILGAHLVGKAGVSLPEDAVIYNLEQVDNESRTLTRNVLPLYRRHAVWDYSATNLGNLATLGITDTTHVPIGYAPVLTRIASTATPDIDVLFYGSVNRRRRDILEELWRRKVKVHALFGVYGASRDSVIARSKLILNVHYYQARVFENVRASYLLANRCVVVSERGANPDEEAVFANGIAFADYDKLVDTCQDLLADPARRRTLAEKGFQAMTAIPVESVLAPALAALVSRNSSF